MVILSGCQQAIQRLANAEVAFVGRLTMVTPNLSNSSSHYTLKFEKELRSLKGSISTIYEFHYQQKLNEQHISNLENVEVPKEGRVYVAILHADNNTIETLIEIEDNEMALF